MLTFDDQFRKLDFIFTLLLSSQIFLALTAVFLLSNDVLSMGELPGPAIKILTMSLNSIFILGLRLTVHKKRQLSDRKSAAEELKNSYVRRSIISMVLLELLNLFNLAAFILTEDYMILIIFALIFMLFLLYRPSKNSFIKEYLPG